MIAFPGPPCYTVDKSAERMRVMEQTAFVSRRLYDKTALLSGLKRRPATASGRFYRAVLRLCAAVFFLCALVMAGCMLLVQNQAQTLLWLMNVVISLAAAA